MCLYTFFSALPSLSAPGPVVGFADALISIEKGVAFLVPYFGRVVLWTPKGTRGKRKAFYRPTAFLFAKPGNA